MYRCTCNTAVSATARVNSGQMFTAEAAQTNPIVMVKQTPG